jgi:hypothetical protein
MRQPFRQGKALWHFDRRHPCRLCGLIAGFEIRQIDALELWRGRDLWMKVGSCKRKMPSRSGEELFFEAEF